MAGLYYLLDNLFWDLNVIFKQNLFLIFDEAHRWLDIRIEFLLLFVAHLINY